MTHIGSNITSPPPTNALVRGIYAAGARLTDWSLVLEQLRRHLDARVLTLGYHDFATGSNSALLQAPQDMDFGAGMADFAARNPWFLSSDAYAPGRVMTSDELISAEDLRRTDFYRGFLRPRGLLHRLCGVVAQRSRGAHLLSAYRAEDQRPFGPHDKAELSHLLEHLTLALESQWRWQEADDFARALLTQTDHDANPLMLVTADAEPIYCNPAAQRLLDAGMGLRFDGTRLLAASHADQRALREAILHAAQSEDPAAAPAPAVLTLACRPPVPPLVVIIRTAGQVFRRESGVRRGLAILSVRGGHALHNPETCAFAHQYELTAAQARVSALVFAGQPLAEIARSLNVSENTVRSHLKQIFQKTDTHSQMDLVHLHARVCVSIP
jgi:DNA-binding CsgD family transcriptional regulator